MSKILFVYTDFFTIYDIAWAFIELGYELEIYEHKFLSSADNPELIEPFSNHLENGDYRFVLSYNFCPDLSRICEQKKLPYVAWTYDALMLPMHQQQICSPYNFTYIFDSEEYEMIRKHFNPPHVYYMPLAANLSRIGGTVITKEDEKRFSSEISFVGNLYGQDEFQELEKRKFLPQPILDYFYYLFDYYTERWNGESIYDCLDQNTCDTLNQIMPEGIRNHYEIPDNYHYAYRLLGRRIAHLDRLLLLSRMAAHFPVALYGPVAELPFQIDQRGPVDYEKEYTKVAYLSKINLHITIPRIPAGVSLRCFDIMGAGGFLMANYRADMLELFEPDRDFVMYTNIDELEQKADYYLHHDDERLAIARNGFEKVASSHTYIHRAKEMLRNLEEAGFHP